MSNYKDWLRERIELDRPPYYIWEGVIWLLHTIEFYPVLEIDENEIDHVHRMRESYGFTSELYSPVSVLEVMVCLAIRCEINIMQNEKFGNRTSLWFWKMFHNLGLDKFRDKKLNDIGDYPDSYEEIESIIFCLLDRNYDHDGNGSLFPVKNCRYDMRKKPMYVQMNIWLTANYHEEE